jgi:hypothetical protein
LTAYRQGVYPVRHCIWVIACSLVCSISELAKIVFAHTRNLSASFIREKKTESTSITNVDRTTRRILSWNVVWARTQEAMQSLVDEAPKAKNTSVMPLMSMQRFGSFLASTKSHKANQTPILKKPITLNCVTTWLAWQDHHAVSRDALMHRFVPSASSFSATTSAN